MSNDTIALACDHGAIALKDHIVTYLKDKASTSLTWA